MAGFRKAKAEQAALKMSFYGPPGSGKTFTALLIAEFLAQSYEGRVAVVDTERGTDFYCQKVPERPVHPDAFDFDALYSKSLTEVLKEVKALDAKTYRVLILDSISHLWDAAMAAYHGNLTRAGTIPLNAWGKIKKPYKDLMAFLINSPFHVLILGRQANAFTEDEDTGEMKAAGVKMRAEKETPHEPHVCVRMESVFDKRSGSTVPTAFIEKDRSGILQGRVFPRPDGRAIAGPLIKLLGGKQGQIQSDDEAGAKDAEELQRQGLERAGKSRQVREELEARFKLCKSAAEVKKLAETVTVEVKGGMTAPDLAAVRLAFNLAMDRAKGLEQQNGEANAEGPAEEQYQQQE